MIIMRRIAAVVASLVVGAILGTASPAQAGLCPEVAGHRGTASTAPENTLPSLVAAAKGEADFVEMDVRWTRTSVPVLMHDETVDRTTNGTGKVSGLYLSQVKALDAGRDFSAAYVGVRVPRLREALAALAPYQTTAVVELKSSVTDAQLSTFAYEVSHYGASGRVLVQSFWPTTLRRFHAIAPKVPLGLITSGAVSDPAATVGAAGAGWWFPASSTVTPELVAAAHAANIKVMPWTVDTPAEWGAMANLGVDAVLTNRPAEYRGWASVGC
jgi:glycerophosphoryl diester phosphodiesterase